MPIVHRTWVLMQLSFVMTHRNKLFKKHDGSQIMWEYFVSTIYPLFTLTLITLNPVHRYFQIISECSCMYVLSIRSVQTFGPVLWGESLSSFLCLAMVKPSRVVTRWSLQSLGSHCLPFKGRSLQSLYFRVFPSLFLLWRTSSRMHCSRCSRDLWMVQMLSQS